MLRNQNAIAAVAAANVERPLLELSGPKLDLAWDMLVSGADEHGGIERYVEAVRLKSAMFGEAFARIDEPPGLSTFKALCAHLPTVRRRIARHLEPDAFAALRERIAGLLESREDTTTTDARIARFCAGFGEDRANRWVRDLAAEILHNLDPGRYPLMCRWVWDARANTGVLREIWHADDIDRTVIDIADRYGTFVMLREELAQYLSQNGVFRDMMQYVDLLTARIYANYISEQGGHYLRADFATPEDPMLHTRRLLGLDGIDANGRSRLKAADGRAVVIDDVKRLN